jgi:hypothetical protein
MSVALLPQVLLRILTDPIYAAKGSALTWVQLDTDLKIIADAIRELAAVGDTSGFTPYNNGTTYSNTLPDYVSYQNNVYEYINPVPQSGITPGTDPLTWQITSQGLFAHERNKDQYLDFGGAAQVSAVDLYNLLNAGPLATEWGDILGTITDQTDLIALLSDYLTQGLNTQTEDLIFDGDSTFNVIIRNGNLDLEGNNLIGLSQIEDSLYDLAIDLDNRSLEGNWAIMSASSLAGTYALQIENSSNQHLYDISNDGQHVLSSRLTIGDFGTVAEPNVSVFNIVTSEANRFMRFKNTTSDHIFDIASNPTYKGLGFYNDDNAAYQLNIMEDGRNVYGGLPPLDDDAIHSFYGAAWFQDEIEMLDSFIMTDTSDSQRIRVTITDRSFVFTEV